jgi:transcriptional regulator with XRE-family HTH domain
MREDLYSMEHRKLREILKRKRIAAGLRQSDVAETTNRSQAYISKFENGDLRLDVVDFVRLCRTIGVDPHTVLDEAFTAD